MGYHLAGYDVEGVDCVPQPDYPFTFHLADATTFPLEGYELYHGSPPCHDNSALRARTGLNGTGWLLAKTRERFARLSVPTVIENVQGARMRRDLTLCGEMYRLDVIRHRYFEVNRPVIQPRHVPHRGRVRGWRHGNYYDGPYVAPYGDGGGKGNVTEWQRAMGIDWITDKAQLAQAIPPAYTCAVGTQLLGYT